MVCLVVCCRFSLFFSGRLNFSVLVCMLILCVLLLVFFGGSVIFSGMMISFFGLFVRLWFFVYLVVMCWELMN